MRLFAFVLAALAVVSGVFAVDVQKSVIVSYSSTTPDSVLDQAKQAIEEGGGVILHEYKLIR